VNNATDKFSKLLTIKSIINLNKEDTMADDTDRDETAGMEDTDAMRDGQDSEEFQEADSDRDAE
jgi:hypothetical protein